jgi:hypothetical protein
MESNNLVARALEEPEILANLSEGDTRRVLVRLLEMLGAVAGKLVEKATTDQIAKQCAAGDRLLEMEEMMVRLGNVSRATLQRGWRAGRYPFILKDGQRLVGSEDGMERWIGARVKRQFRS